MHGLIASPILSSIYKTKQPPGVMPAAVYFRMPKRMFIFKK